MDAAAGNRGCDHGRRVPCPSLPMSSILPPARPLLGLAIALSLAGCAATTASKPTAVEANVTTKAVGYLDKTAVPASIDLVPAPPAAELTGKPSASRHRTHPTWRLSGKARRASPRWRGRQWACNRAIGIHEGSEYVRGWPMHEHVLCRILGWPLSSVRTRHANWRPFGFDAVLPRPER